MGYEAYGAEMASGAGIAVVQSARTPMVDLQLAYRPGQAGMTTMQYVGPGNVPTAPTARIAAIPQKGVLPQVVAAVPPAASGGSTGQQSAASNLTPEQLKTLLANQDGYTFLTTPTASASTTSTVAVAAGAAALLALLLL